MMPLIFLFSFLSSFFTSQDDLRQGKPPPAVKKHHLARKIRIRRPRQKKGMPFKPSGAKGEEGATTDIEADDADMTDDVCTREAQLLMICLNNFF